MSLVSAYLILDDVPLSEEAAVFVKSFGAFWRHLHHRNGRQLVDAMAPEDAVPAILAAMAPLHPLVAGLWHDDGSPAHRDLYPFCGAELVEVMPDVAHGEGQPTTRPTAPFEFHRWAGWAERVMA